MHRPDPALRHEQRREPEVAFMMESSMPIGWFDSPEQLAITYASTVIEVTGEIDVATAAEFRRALLMCDTDPIVRALDLSAVTFFSAAGVRCFVEADWPRRPHVGIIASCPVRRVLDLCGLTFLLAPHGWCHAFDGWTSSVICSGLRYEMSSSPATTSAATSRNGRRWRRA
jgi:anti-anti-sigma factor